VLLQELYPFLLLWLREFLLELWQKVKSDLLHSFRVVVGFDEVWKLLKGGLYIWICSFIRFDDAGVDVVINKHLNVVLKCLIVEILNLVISAKHVILELGIKLFFDFGP
jgi:hypothetical protein